MDHTEEDVSDKQYEVGNSVINYLEYLMSLLKSSGVNIIASDSIYFKSPILNGMNGYQRDEKFDSDIKCLLEDTKIVEEKIVEAYFKKDNTIYNVYIKILPLSIDSISVVEEIYSEVKLLTLANNSSIPVFYGIWENKKEFSIVIEAIKGTSLETLLETNLDLNSRLEICFIIASALKEIHMQGLSHKDLKPNLILFNSNKKDFCDLCKDSKNIICICGLKFSSFGEGRINSRTMTFTSIQMNNSLYKAPEFFNINIGEENNFPKIKKIKFTENNVNPNLCEEFSNNDEKEMKTLIVSNIKQSSVKKSLEEWVIGPPSDIWALGCIMSEVFSGIKPWKNVCKSLINLEMKLSKKKKFEIPKLNLIDDKFYDIKQKIENLISMCTEIKPLNRCSSEHISNTIKLLLNKLKEETIESCKINEKTFEAFNILDENINDSQIFNTPKRKYS